VVVTFVIMVMFSLHAAEVFSFSINGPINV